MWSRLLSFFARWRIARREARLKRIQWIIRSGLTGMD
jgi:hypothetical protein